MRLSKLVITLLFGCSCVCALLGSQPTTSKPPSKGKVGENKKNSTIPYDFKGYTHGFKYSTIEDNPPLNNFTNGDDLHKTVLFSDTIADEDCQVFLMFDDFGNGLELDYISVTANKDKFKEISDALVGKFGKPTSRTSLIKKNAMGATFYGKRLYWDNGVSSLEAEEIGSKIDECQISWFYPKPGKSKKEKVKEQKAATDL